MTLKGQINQLRILGWIFWKKPPILCLALTWRYNVALCCALLLHGQAISDSVDRMISNLKTVQYFIIKLTLQLYNILGLMSVKFEINRLYIFRTMAS